MTPSSPILVLDSGLGGLTVARALRVELPHEDLVYFGDTARLPYGSKGAGTVTGFVRQIIAYLRPLNPKHVVLACNTATALALPALRREFPDLPISGVIEPGAKAAVAAAGAKVVPVIGVLATEATIRSRAYERAIRARRSLVKLLLRPAPLLVPIIEEGRRGDDPLVRLAIRQYLHPLVRRGVDVLVLGCTHYPILKELIQEVVGPGVGVIDSAEWCADDVARRLRAAGMLRPEEVRRSGVRPESAGSVLTARPTGSLRCYVTDDPERFQRLAGRFLGVPIARPEWVAPEVLYGPAPAPPAAAGGLRAAV